MATVKNIRKYLGLSLRDLASYLKVSKSQVDKVERGIAQFDIDAILKMDKLENYTKEALLIKLMKKENSNKGEPVAGYNITEIKCRYALAVLRKKLDEMKVTNEQMTHLTHVLERLKEYDPNNPWIKNQQCKCSKKLQACCNRTIEEVQAKVDLLTAEADMLTQYMQKRSMT